MTSGTKWAFVAGLLGAFIGGGAALAGATITANASRDMSSIQVLAEREKEKREKLAEVYNAYLDAAVGYNIASDNYFRASATSEAVKGAIAALKRLAADAGAPRDEIESSANIEALPLDEPTLELRRSRDEAAVAFEVAINNLAVYGSDQAWEIHEDLVPVLTNPNSGTNVQISLVDQERFNELVAKFRAVFCDSVALEKASCSARAQQE